MQKISKSLEELVQEKLLSKKAADIAPNTPKTPNVANATPKTSTMEDGTYYLEPSKDDPNKLVGKIWGKRPTDPEALKKYQETFERTYAANKPLQKATQQWGQNIGYGKNYTDSAQTANRKLRQEEIGGAENVDQEGDSTFTKLRKGWNRAKAQNNLPEMRRYQNQINTEWANYARAAGLKNPQELLGKLSKEQMAMINAKNVQAMFPDMQRYSVVGNKFDANALAKQKGVYIPKLEDIQVKDELEGFAGAGKGVPEDIAKRRQEIYNERIEAMRKAYANDPEKLYQFEQALNEGKVNEIKAQGTPATEEQKQQLVAQKQRVQNAANVAQDAYTQAQGQKQQVSDANIVTDPDTIRYLNNARGIPGQFGVTGSIYNFFTGKDKNFKEMPGGKIRNLTTGEIYQPRGNEYEVVDPNKPSVYAPRRDVTTGRRMIGTDVLLSQDGKTYTYGGDTFDVGTNAPRTQLSDLHTTDPQAYEARMSGLKQNIMQLSAQLGSPATAGMTRTQLGANRQRLREMQKLYNTELRRQAILQKQGLW